MLPSLNTSPKSHTELHSKREIRLLDLVTMPFLESLASKRVPGKGKHLEGKQGKAEILLQVLYSVLEILTLQAALPEHFQCGFQLTLNLAQLQVSYLILLVCKLGKTEGRNETIFV